MSQTRRKLGSSFADALSLVRSTNQRSKRAVVAGKTGGLGLNPQRLFDAVAEFSGGGQSFVGYADRADIPPELLTYYAAWLGLIQNSPGVVTFVEGAGADRLVIFSLGPIAPDQLSAALDLSAAPARWVMPSPEGLRVMVLVHGGEGESAVEWLSKLSRTAPLVVRGIATILGGSTNAAGRAAYRDIIARAEGTAGTGVANGPGDGPVHAPTGGAVYRGIFYPGGQVIPGG